MTPSRILAVRLGAMGDILHTLPAVVSLKQSFPESHVAWAVEERWTPLLRNNSFVDEIIAVKRRSWTAVLELRRKLRHARFDTAVDFQGLLKSALVAMMAQPERLIGLHRSAAREPLASLFYSKVCKPRGKHVVDRQIELAQCAGATAMSRIFPLPAGEPEGDLPAGSFVLASPLAGWESKQWPASYYTDLGRMLGGAGYSLVVNGPHPMSIPGAISHISGLPGLIDATRRAAAVVGVDSGPMHLAAALGKPGVAIFGPTDPERNGPYGGSLRVLRSPRAITSYKRRSQIDPSMQAITADEVWEALRPQLEK